MNPCLSLDTHTPRSRDVQKLPSAGQGRQRPGTSTQTQRNVPAGHTHAEGLPIAFDPQLEPDSQVHALRPDSGLHAPSAECISPPP